jgi:hypothetical protein
MPMQRSQASLKRAVNVYSNPFSLSKAKERSEKLLSGPSSHEKLMRAYKSRATLSFSKEKSVHTTPEKTLQHQNILVDEDCIKAANCLSSIEDPLWKRVCRDVIRAMGAASFLKIWDSILGEFYPQDQSIEIHCQSEETAQFIQQYDFVILGSLQPYFPSLKHLRIKTISS